MYEIFFFGKAEQIVVYGISVEILTGKLRTFIH